MNLLFPSTTANFLISWATMSFSITFLFTFSNSRVSSRINGLENPFHDGFGLHPLNLKPLSDSPAENTNKSWWKRGKWNCETRKCETGQIWWLNYSLIPVLMLVALNIPVLSHDHFLCERNEMQTQVMRRWWDCTTLVRGQEHCPPCFRRLEIALSLGDPLRLASRVPRHHIAYPDSLAMRLK